MTFVIRTRAGFYYHGIGGLGHRVFCDHLPEAKVFADRGDAERVRAEIDALPDPNPSVCLLDRDRAGMSAPLSRADRLALAAVIVACAVAFAASVWWGMPLE